MEQALSLEQYQGFYNQWASVIFGYCRLFLGDEQHAEEATAESFSKYFERIGTHSPAERSSLDRQPMALLTQAVLSCRGRHVSGPNRNQIPLNKAVSSLPASAREVFIIHGLLRLRLPEVAAVTGRSISSAEHLWIASLLNIRTLWLKKGELAELTEQCLSNIRELLLRRGRSL